MLSLSPKNFFPPCFILALWTFSNCAYAAETTRVSVGPSGTQASGFSYQPSVSADGRYVAYVSDATNLVAGDTNFADDIFVYDRTTKLTTRVSVDSNGNQQDGFSSDPNISADGRYITFVSNAPNLVAGDTNDTLDVFVHDRQAKQTTRISVDSSGVQGNEGSYHPNLSATGRYVTFQSSADNLVAEDTNTNPDIFVYDRVAEKTSRVSVGPNKAQANNSSFFPKISADGRYVAFVSNATNLVADDTNNAIDSFIHDRKTKRTTRVSVNSNGGQQNSDSIELSISADGRYVAFESFADNLISGDTNNASDSFVHDRKTKLTTRVSVASNEAQGDQDSIAPRLSADGRYVLFESRGSALVAGDNNETSDVFAHDRQTKRTSLVSVSAKGTQGNEVSLAGSMSADGSIVAFQSFANNLIASDTNGNMDIFASDRTLDIVGQADLQITATKQPKELTRDNSGTYIYTITNNGPDTVNEVSVTYLASGSRDASFAPSQGSCYKGFHILSYLANLCNMGKLSSGNSLTLTVFAKAHHNPLLQKVTVSSKLIDKVPNNDTVSVSTTVKKRCCQGNGKAEDRD